MIILALIATALLCSYIAWVVRWSRTWRVDTKVPVLKGGLPIIGHVHQVPTNTRQLWEFLTYVSYQSIDSGGIIKGYLGPMPYYMVTDPKIAMKILNTCMEKHYLYRFASNWIGEGLITAYEPTWKRHRKLLNPTFNQHILDGFMEVFNRQSEQLAGKFSEHVGKEPFNHWPYLADSALEIVCKTAFGIEEANDDVIDLEYKNAVARIFHIMINRLMRVWLHPESIYNLTPSKREEDELVAYLKKMSTNVIQQKQAARQNRTVEKPAENSTRKFRTFLDQLLDLEAEGSLTAEEIRDEVDSMIIAAHDTSSATLMYTLVLVGSYPEVQEKIYQEIGSVREISSGVIQQKQAARQNRTVEKPAENSTRKFRTFLDQLLDLEAEGSLTAEEIRDEVDSMIIAAHDTSSATLMYTLVLVGSYPEVQEKIYQEIKEVFGDSDRDVSKDDMNKLVYLEAVLKESLRIYTVTSMVARCAEEDVEVEGYTIPSGAAIIISLWGINKNRFYWGQDAAEFKPERWFDAATLPEHPGAFAAFSMGKRGCIGKIYGLMSMKTTLVHVLRKFRVTADHKKMTLKLDVLLKAHDGNQISVEYRN